MCEPAPRTMMGGSPPTDLNARAGESTPPGITCSARFCSARDLVRSKGKPKIYHSESQNLEPRRTQSAPRINVIFSRNGVILSEGGSRAFVPARGNPSEGPRFPFGDAKTPTKSADRIEV